MTNVAIALREEITRITRREVRTQTAVLQRASVQFRHDIPALKREVTRLERELKQQHRVNRPAVPVGDGDSGSMRFVAKGFRTLRHRLGLSASQMGTVFGRQ